MLLPLLFPQRERCNEEIRNQGVFCGISGSSRWMEQLFLYKVDDLFAVVDNASSLGPIIINACLLVVLLAFFFVVGSCSRGGL